MRLKKMFENDYVALDAISFAGNMTTEGFLKAGISSSRIESYRRDHLIGEIGYQGTRGHKDPETTWGITEKGRRFIKAELNETCASSKLSPRHNSEVAEQYLSVLMRDDVKSENIFTEKEVEALVLEKLEKMRIEYHEDYIYWQGKHSNHELSMPDITYITDSGAIEIIEVITYSYTQGQIDEKAATAEFLNADIKYINIK